MNISYLKLDTEVIWIPEGLKAYVNDEDSSIRMQQFALLLLPYLCVGEIDFEQAACITGCDRAELLMTYHDLKIDCSRFLGDELEDIIDEIYVRVEELEEKASIFSDLLGHNHGNCGSAD